MSPSMTAIKNMQETIKNAILNEEVNMDFSPAENKNYYAELKVFVGKVVFAMTIADKYICYHNPFIDGMFDDPDDFKELANLAKKHVRTLTEDDINEIEKLKKQIDDIMKGGVK